MKKQSINEDVGQNALFCSSLTCLWPAVNLEGFPEGR